MIINHSQRMPLLTRQNVIDTINKLLDNEEKDTNTKIINRVLDNEAITQTIYDYDDFNFGELTTLDEWVEEQLFDYLESYENIEL